MNVITRRNTDAKFLWACSMHNLFNYNNINKQKHTIHKFLNYFPASFDNIHKSLNQIEQIKKTIIEMMAGGTMARSLFDTKTLKQTKEILTFNSNNPHSQKITLKTVNITEFRVQWSNKTNNYHESVVETHRFSGTPNICVAIYNYLIYYLIYFSRSVCHLLNVTFVQSFILNSAYV